MASTHAGTVTTPADRSFPGEEPPGAVSWGPPRGRHAALRAGRRALVLAHSSTVTRRFIPLDATVHLIDAFATFSERRKSGLWQQNVSFYGDLLRHTSLAGSEERVAAEAMREFMVCVELFWRPWLMRRGIVEKRQVLRAAQREGRGVVGVFPHFGPSYAQFPSLLGYGIDAWVVASPHHYEETAGDSYDVRFARQGARYLDMLGPGHVVQRAGDASVSAFGEMRDMLRSGKTVLIAFDIIGNLPTPFLGRRLRLTNGPARLAKEADALVVPIVNRRQGSMPVVKFGETLDPRHFDDVESLQSAIAGQMEQWALEAPEAVWPLHTQPGGSPLIRGDVIRPSRTGAR